MALDSLVPRLPDLFNVSQEKNGEPGDKAGKGVGTRLALEGGGTIPTSSRLEGHVPWCPPVSATYVLLRFSINTLVAISLFYVQNFRTSSNQPDCKQYKGGVVEYTPALEAYVAVLSGGPVGPSDQVGTANVTLIMATW